MEQSRLVKPLSGTARMALDGILRQFGRRAEALRGVMGKIIEKDLVYRRGKFVVTEVRETDWSPEEEARAGVMAPFEDLDDPALVLEELPPGGPNEIRVRIASAAGGKFDWEKFPREDNFAWIMRVDRLAERLLDVEMELTNIPRWLRWMIREGACRIEYAYLRGVPVPKSSSLRILSRGIGPLRFGMGGDVEMRFDAA